MKRSCIAFLLAAAMALTACSQTAGQPQSTAPSTAVTAKASGADLASSDAAEEQSGSASGETASEMSLDTPLAELNQPDGRLLLYRFLPDAMLYEAVKLLDMPQSPSCYDVLSAVAAELFPDTELPAVNAITLQKSYLVCDLSEQWLDVFNKGQLYEFCNTLTMTLMRNCQYESLGFMIDGEFGLLGGEVWDTAELKLLEAGDPAEFAAIRAKIPYRGLGEPRYSSIPKMAESLTGDQTAQEIYRVLALAGELPNEFDHPNGHDMDYAILHLLWCTDHIITNPDEHGYDVETAVETAPLMAAVSQRLGMTEEWVWLREHIEESARLLYGDDFEVIHRQPRLPYKWLETEGVYTPPHMGLGWSILPYIYSYTENDDVVAVEAAYIMESMSGYADADEKSIFIDEGDIAGYLQGKTKRHVIALEREDDGRLTLQSHHIINSGGN